MTNRVTIDETRHIVAVTSAGSLTVTDDSQTEVVEVGAMGPQGPVATAATAAEMLASLITVDGTGSGLDADLLDGQHGAYYAAASALAGYQPLDSDLTALAALTTTAYGRALLELANAAALRTAAGTVIGTDVQAYSAVLAATTASYTSAEQTKLAGIATGATANSSDATLLARANHTGTQLAATISDFATAVGAIAQPLDSDLTAIAALATTSFGRALLALADAAALRTAAGLGTIATQAANSVSISGGSITGITDLAVADGGTGASDAATARTNLGVDAAGTAASAVSTHAALSATHGVAGAIVGTTDSQTLTNKTLTTPTLTLKQSTTPAPTAEGDIQWDTDDNRIVVGDGAAAKTFSDDTVNRARANHTGTQTLSTISDAGTIASQAANNVAITGGSVTGITDLAVADGGTGASTAAGARTNLGLVIGTDVQAYDAELAAIAGLTSAADRLPYFTGSGTAALATFTSAGRALVDDADATAQRTTLGLGSLATLSTITTSEITDGTIVNADISASAAIDGTKLVAATTSAQGAVELATAAETTTGTDFVRAVTPYGLNRVNTWIESRRRWGILNGGGDLGDTTGWVRYSDRSLAATYTWDTTDGSFVGTSQYASLASELLFLDTGRDFVATYYYYGGRTGDHVVYIGYYDADQLAMTTGMVQAVSGSTDTTLASTLSNGATTISLTSATGWYNGANSWQRTITLWPYTDGQGRAWGNYTYSRNMYDNAWAAGGISGTTITLSTPWAGGTFPAGSAVRNGDNGDQLSSYFEAFPVITPSTWYRVRSTIAYTDLKGSGAGRYVTMTIISNFAGAGVTSRVRGVSLSQNY